MDHFRFGFQPSSAAAAPGDDQGQGYGSGSGDGEEQEELMPAAEEHQGRGGPAPGVLLPGLELVSLQPGAGGITLVKHGVAPEGSQLLGIGQEADLVPNVYEGGLKLWEGALDLCHHLCRLYNLDARLLADPRAPKPLQGKKVLELGCGHGLPGILMLLAGAEVHFQDFNKEVLTHLTMPNVAANLRRLAVGSMRPSHRYFSGDWASVGELLTTQGYGGHYDLILTAESIYSTSSQRRLLECVKQVLQPPHGIVLVAAKSYYFGVGGGVQSFTAAIKSDNLFDVRHVYKTGADVLHAITAASAKDLQPKQLQQEESHVLQKHPPAEQVQQQEGGGAAFGSTASQNKGRDAEGGGGLFREVLELSFPESIQPYFL